MHRLFLSAGALALAGSMVLTASAAVAKGKPIQRGKSQVTGACMSSGSTITAQNKTGTVTASVAFKSQRACAHFLKNNRALTVHSSTAGVNTAGLEPSGTTMVRGNSAAAQFCPARGSTSTVYFKTSASSTVGKVTFSSPLKSHGECVSYFAKNKSLQIVTSPATASH